MVPPSTNCQDIPSKLIFTLYAMSETMESSVIFFFVLTLQQEINAITLCMYKYMFVWIFKRKVFCKLFIWMLQWKENSTDKINRAYRETLKFGFLNNRVSLHNHNRSWQINRSRWDTRICPEVCQRHHTWPWWTERISWLFQQSKTINRK